MDESVILESLRMIGAEDQSSSRGVRVQPPLQVRKQLRVFRARRVPAVDGVAVQLNHGSRLVFVAKRRVLILDERQARQLPKRHECVSTHEPTEKGHSHQ